VDTPLTLRTDEGGADVELGYRFGRIEQLGFLGKPSPYLIGSLNTRGDTSFVGGGLGWKLGRGAVYVRPEIGIVVQDGPSLKVAPNGTHLELGSRVLFEPGIGVGTRLGEHVSVEASWVHISQGRVFNYQQNPGVDMWGARLNWKL
jgi:lipid A 3-O-deacylase